MTTIDLTKLTGQVPLEPRQDGVSASKVTGQVPLEPLQAGVSGSKLTGQVPLEAGGGMRLAVSKTYATAVMAPALVSVAKTYATAVMVPPDQLRTVFPMKF